MTALLLAVAGSFVLLLALPLTSVADLPLGSTVGGLVNNVTGTLQTTVQQVVSAASPAPGGGGPGATGTPTSAPAKLIGSAAPASSPTSTPKPALASAAAPASTPAASSPGYTPPMYGTNPHGQGTVASLGVGSSSSVPYGYSPGGSSSSGEALVLGRGRSEQSGSSYDAHTTIVGLLGTELLGVNATQGQSNTGPLSPLQNGVLTPICTGTNAMVCLTLLAANTSAYPNGANTQFSVANLSSQQIAGLNASAASSDSSISQSGTCQAASGDSSVANLTLASGPVASVSQSSESSNACAGQTPTQSAGSSVIGLGGTGVGLPAPGCANGTPNTAFSLLAPVLPIYCNADSTGQASDPAGVREALTVLGLQSVTSSLLRVTTAASEAHVVAPVSTTTTTGTGNVPNGNGGQTSLSGSGSGKGKGNGHGNGTGSGGKSSNNCTDADHNCGIGSNGVPEACVAGVDPDGDGDCVIGANRFAGQITAAKSPSSLPFTGENVLEVILVGLILAGVGLALSLRGKVPAPIRKQP